VAAGTKPSWVSIRLTKPIQDVFRGSRYGQLKDPFAHSWSIGSPLKS